MTVPGQTARVQVPEEATQGRGRATCTLRCARSSHDPAESPRPAPPHIVIVAWSRVAGGERIVVTEHDKPVAALGPVGESDEDRALLELVHEGRAEWTGGKPLGARRPARVKGRTVAAAVIDRR